MIGQPPILALLLVSALASVVALWSGWFGLRVLRYWNLASGSRAQLEMERQTELVSTLFGFVMAAELAALLLFVYNADRMASLFVGAMCAVGTLNVDPYGFPALYVKIAVFFAAVVWLILDRVDRAGYDYPLTKVKYAAILLIAPLVLVGAGLELAYFLGLETDVITSCCSKLFTPVNEGLAGQMTGFGPGISLTLLAGVGSAVVLTGAMSLWRGRAWYGAYAVSGLGLFLMALTAIVSVISLYVYETPNHHCPFCILQPEYNYYGYALYLPLFTGTAFALGAGVSALFCDVESLRTRLPGMLRTQVRVSMAAFALFGLAVTWAIVSSRLILFG